jgi:hypothetical protein
VKAALAALLTAAVVAPAGFAVGTAHDPRVPALQRRIAALENTQANLQQAQAQDHSCLFSIARAWERLGIYTSPPYGQLALNKASLSDCP